MSQLVYSTVPVLLDVDDGNFNVGNPAYASLLQQVADNARAAAVRTELIYMGWFRHADVVPQPISPVDGYVYSRAETRYLVAAFFSQPAGVFSPGQKTRPYANPSRGLKIDFMSFDVDDSTGAVLSSVYYEAANPNYPGGGQAGATNDGLVKVLAVCTRQSVNNDGGIN